MVALVAFSSPASAAEPFDVLIRGGTVYDGTAARRARPTSASAATRSPQSATSRCQRQTTIDAAGLAVAPGFVNMLSWSTDSLLADGRSQGELREGVTTQIMGEGNSWGPVNDAIKKRMKSEQTDIKYEIEWTTLSDYLTFLERHGVSQNVRLLPRGDHGARVRPGLGNVKPTPAQLEQMRRLIEREMRDGALGIASALEYAPATTPTEELIELCKVAARYRGKYVSHMRSEGDKLLEAIDELIRISREAKAAAEIYHFKAAGVANWPKMDAPSPRSRRPAKDGLPITANIVRL